MTSTPGDGQPPHSDEPGQPPQEPSTGPSEGTEPTQPLSGWTPSPGSPYAEQPYAGQPEPGPPYGEQPYAGQAYPPQPYAGQPYAGQPYGPPAGWYPGPQPYRLPDHPDSTKALVLGIIALLGGFTCYLPILLGPWAWAVGRRAVADIDNQPGRYEGRSQAMAGYVMGIVATVLLILGVLALVGFIAFIVILSVTGSGTSTGAEF